MPARPLLSTSHMPPALDSSLLSGHPPLQAIIHQFAMEFQANQHLGLFAAVGRLLTLRPREFQGFNNFVQVRR